MIPIGARPAFFERMYYEVVKLNSKQIKQNLDSLNDMSGLYSNVQIGPLGTIREENSINDKFNEKNHVSNHYQKEVNKIQLLTHLNQGLKRSVVTFNDIPQDLIIKSMLFFLDIHSLPKFSMVSKKTNESVKTHIFIRLYFLNKEKKMIEQENSEIISSIEQKRQEFFEEYEIEAPNKDHAVQLMNTIKNSDIIELKQCFKKYNKNYETIISPLVLLLGQKVKESYKI